MRKDEEVKELFFLNIHDVASLFHVVPNVTQNGIWIRIEFGNLADVKARGYRAALRALHAQLDKLVE